MLRVVFGIFLCFIYNCCAAQITPSYVIEQYHDWNKNQSIELNESNKSAYQQLLLKNFIQKAENQFCYPKTEDFETHNLYETAWSKLLQKFHLVDLDDDGDLDLIFAGKMCEDSEIEYLMIYMCDFKTYTMELFTEGKPVLLNNQNEFVCLASASAHSIENVLKVFQFKEDKVEEIFQVKMFDSPALRKSTKQASIFKNIIPKQLDIVQECEIPAGTTTYLTPNDSIPRSDLIAKSTVHQLRKAQKVTIFNTLTDRKQQKWMYVSYREESNPSSFILGWIKATNCN